MSSRTSFMIDMSHWQSDVGKIYPERVAKIVGGVIIKSSERYGEDPSFSEIASAFDGVLPRGSYHYLHPETPLFQAATALKATRPHNLEMIHFVDVEKVDRKGNAELSPDMVISYADEYENLLGRTGVVGLYSGKWYLDAMAKRWGEQRVSRLAKRFDGLLWLANYDSRWKGIRAGDNLPEPGKNEQPSVPHWFDNDDYTVWQVSSTAKVDGITGNVDLNYVNPKFLDNIMIQGSSPDTVLERRVREIIPTIEALAIQGKLLSKALGASRK